jgi:hypothetical protein
LPVITNEVIFVKELYKREMAVKENIENVLHTWNLLSRQTPSTYTRKWLEVLNILKALSIMIIITSLLLSVAGFVA